jgi:hypothetical protein
MLLTSMGYQLDNHSTYWAKNFIDKAYELDILKDGDFDDYSKGINRAEMTRMIIRAMDESIDDYYMYKNNLDDFHTIPAEFGEYVLKAYGLGIVAGIGNGFVPFGLSTRAQAAVMINRLIDPAIRIKTLKKGISDEGILVKEYISIMSNGGYVLDMDIEDIKNNILNRETYYHLLYNYIIHNKELYEIFIPLKEVHINSFRVENTADMGKYAKKLWEYGAENQNFNELDYYAISETTYVYADGREREVIIYNPFVKRHELYKAQIEHGVYHTYSSFKEIEKGLERVSTFDHTRFADLFSDAGQISEEFREEIYRLYHYGAVSYYEEKPYEMGILMSPKGIVTPQEIAEFFRRVKDKDIIVLDEKDYGENDWNTRRKWGTENTTPYIVRLPFAKSILIYDRLNNLSLWRREFTFEYYGAVQNLSNNTEPLVGAVITIEDKTNSITNPDDTFYNTSIKFSGSGIPASEIHNKLDSIALYLPSGYIEQFTDDLFDEKQWVKQSFELGDIWYFKKTYGDTEVNMKKDNIFLKGKSNYQIYIKYTR